MLQLLKQEKSSGASGNWILCIEHLPLIQRLRTTNLPYLKFWIEEAVKFWALGKKSSNLSLKKNARPMMIETVEIWS